MKRFLYLVFLSLSFLLVYYNKEKIMTFYASVLKDRSNIKLEYKNDYHKEANYNYVQLTNKFIVDNKKELLNVYYTVIDSGVKEFTFFCGDDYKNCIDDVMLLADDQQTLSNVNAFVHPYNSFESIMTTYDTLGRITIEINKIYDNDTITTINTKVKEIMNKIVGNETDKRKIIKLVHDYIVNSTKYDSDKADNKITRYASNTAYGPLLQGYGICGGYTDSMAIFLNNYGIPNFKVISENHIWNVIYLDGKWYHLDLTWDDPITSDGKQTLDYTFFLISTTELLEQEKVQHNFDINVFSEISK